MTRAVFNEAVELCRGLESVEGDELERRKIQIKLLFRLLEQHTTDGERYIIAQEIHKFSRKGIQDLGFLTTAARSAGLLH